MTTPPERALGVHTVALERRALVVVVGELDQGTVGEVGTAVDACLSGRPERIEMDLSAVAFCDCSGLNGLLRARHRAVRAGTSLCVISAGQAVRRLFDLAQVGGLFDLPRRP